MEQKSESTRVESADNAADVAAPKGGNSSANGRAANKHPNKRPLLIIVALILAGLMGFAGSWARDYLMGDTTSRLTVLNTSKEDGNNVVTPNEESIAAVAKAVSPSVVSILTTSSQISRLYNQQYQQEGAGTGMIVSSNGYIMTNKHVIDGADKVTVVLPDGKTYDNVDVLGSDPLNDVAFLKIRNVSGLPAIVLGDSKTIRIGQSVVAIGNALGQYQNSVTSGIVSGTGRPVTASSDGSATGSTENLTDLIQTDAAINSGNSGGPLLNLKGQVIGINTAIAQDAQSIGFAIPIGATKGLLAHVIKTGKVERSYLGIQYVSITPSVKEQYHLSVNKGDYIIADHGNSVQTNGPAAKAGVKAGDIITQVNGFNVGEVASVSTLISEYESGQDVQLTVVRDGKELKLTATLGTYQS
jgi:serine protease Do